MAKERTKRYQQAIHMSTHLKKLGEGIDKALAKKKRDL
jgi:hypothetical protein